MPDIAMCKGENCKLKKDCYRYMAIPTEYRQSYFLESPIKEEVCDQFFPISSDYRLDPKKIKDRET